MSMQPIVCRLLASGTPVLCHGRGRETAVSLAQDCLSAGAVVQLVSVTSV